MLSTEYTSDSINLQVGAYKLPGIESDVMTTATARDFPASLTGKNK